MKFDTQDIINGLRIELKKSLPGKSAHSKVLPSGRPLEPPLETKKINQAGVLMLLFPDKGKINTVFIRRPSFMKNHAGQIAFPGGQFEAGDKNLMQTALREAAEEIGIVPGQIEIIGRLSPLYVNVSNYCIKPFIGWSQSIPDFRFDTKEVTGIHIIQVDDLLIPSKLQSREVDTSHGITDFPGYLVDDIFIWGATAMILSEFIEVYRKAIGV